MKILLVSDQYYAANNGMTISARRFAGVLRQHGHEVRIMSYGTPDMVEDQDTAYLLDKYYVPIFNRLVTAQGMVFAKRTRKVVEAAVDWADLIHILSPFFLSHRTIRIAQKKHKPFTAAFHVQPQNITSSVYLGKVNWINDLLYHFFHRYIYRYCTHIHCPSQFIANQLVRTGYTEQLHVISNGIDPDFHYFKRHKPKELRDKFVILQTGRLSIEKRPDVLIRAVAMSRHADQIQLILAGKGPRKKKLQKLADKLLENSVIIQFFNKPELIQLLGYCDLYVHAADVEIEAMSCMEAFASGLVPVIANSCNSATPQFALDERSLFEADNSKDLAEKIDWWIEHPVEREQMELRYAELGKKYALEDCVRQAEAMFEQAVNENHGK